LIACLAAGTLCLQGCAKADREAGDGNVSSQDRGVPASSAERIAATASLPVPTASEKRAPAFEAEPSTSEAASQPTSLSQSDHSHAGRPSKTGLPTGSGTGSEPLTRSLPRKIAKATAAAPAATPAPESLQPDIEESPATGVSKSALPAPRAACPSPVPESSPSSMKELLPRLDERAAEKKGGVMETPDGRLQCLVTDEEATTAKIRVFYGTDRAVVDQAAQGRPSDRWFHGTAWTAAITMVLAGLCFLRPGRTTVIASALGLAATAVLGSTTLYVSSHAVPLAAEKRAYGNQRGTLELGFCDVTLPRRHEVGRVERPSVFRLELVENPLKHVIVQSVKQVPTERFYRELKARVDNSERKEACVFIHGYNVDFESAARRTAQIAHDLRFEGAPIFFSWPSQGNPLGYTVDETNVVWTVPHLKEFLLNVARQSGAEAVHLVAHSMGNRALTSALKELFYELDAECPRFHDVVLTAPDIDAETFRRDLAPAVIRTARRVTLYASSNDEALVLSKKVHGYARAGDSGEYLVVVPGMDTIDVSEVDTSLLGHSYYGNNHTVLADLYDLLREWKPPEQRKFLRSMHLGSLRYWTFIR